MQTALSSLVVCEHSLNTRHARNFVSATYSLILQFYEVNAVFDGNLMELGRTALNNILDYATRVNVPNYQLVSFEPQIRISNLLIHGKAEEALVLFRTLFQILSKDSQMLLFSATLLFDVIPKDEDFAKKIAEYAKQYYPSIKVEIKINKEKTGRTIGVNEGNIEIETGNEEDNNLALWLKSHLES